MYDVSLYNLKIVSPPGRTNNLFLIGACANTTLPNTHAQYYVKIYYGHYYTNLADSDYLANVTDL